MDILKVTLNEDKPTRILYASNTSWSTLQRAFKRLISLGFIEVEIIARENKDAHRYYVTKEGKEVIRFYSKLIKIYDGKTDGKLTKLLGGKFK